MKRARIRCWLLGAGLMAAASLAYPAACTVSTLGLNFGNYDVFSTLNDDITGTVSVNCPSSTAYSISLSSGSGTFASRAMTSGTNLLYYNLYLDATRLTIWGDGSAGTGTVSGREPERPLAAQCMGEYRGDRTPSWEVIAIASLSL